MPEEILNPSDFHVGWLAQSLAGDIYVIVKATDKTVTEERVSYATGIPPASAVGRKSTLPLQVVSRGCCHSIAL